LTPVEQNQLPAPEWPLDTLSVLASGLVRPAVDRLELPSTQDEPEARAREAATDAEARDGSAEKILAEFRDWLTALPEEVLASGPEPAGELLDVHSVLSQFVTLRQEVNLTTRAVRGQQEQNNETLRVLQQALETLQRSHAEVRREQQLSQEERLRPVLKTLIDLHDALALAGREVSRIQELVLPDLETLRANGLEQAWASLEDIGREGAVGTPADLPPSQPSLPAAPRPIPHAPRPKTFFWARWFGSTAPAGQPPTLEQASVPGDAETVRQQLDQARREGEQAGRVAEAARWKEIVDRVRQQLAAREEVQRTSSERIQQTFSGLAAGYTLSLQRIERALRQHGLEPIPAVGEMFDPEQMEVLEAVSGSGQPAGVVVEEVRRGYLWNGRVFRFSQVRVARG
jgi:molecular chaperone GrpE (heat shock protein)